MVLKEELMLNIVSLTNEFHQANMDLSEALHDKGRGYGVVRIHLNGLTFGIPLRSNLKHRNGVVLDKVIRDGKELKRGLDYTKAVLIRNELKELGSSFKVSKEQKQILINRKKSIHKQFEKYVNTYIRAVEKDIKNTLTSPTYRYSTLVNYHSELGL
jgi:protein AbiQ